MQFKKGDKVKIKSIDWFNSQPKNEYGSVQCGDEAFTETMSEYCGKILTIKIVGPNYFYLEEDKSGYQWNEHMIEFIEKPVSIKINIPEGYEIDQEKSTFEKIVFKKIETLPKTWNEFCEQNPITIDECFINCISGIAKMSISRNRNCVSDATLLKNKEDAEAHLALIQLHRLRDVYRQGWKPNWNNGTNKYCITNFSNACIIEQYHESSHFLSFQSQKIAEEFLKNFRDLIEKAKDLI